MMSGLLKSESFPKLPRVPRAGLEPASALEFAVVLAEMASAGAASIPRENRGFRDGSTSCTHGAYRLVGLGAPAGESPTYPPTWCLTCLQAIPSCRCPGAPFRGCAHG